MKSYVVIGGGLAGLAAANALVGNDSRVTLLDQSRRLGGRAQTLQQGGFLLTLGPYALYRGGIARCKHFAHGRSPFRGRLLQRENGLILQGETSSTRSFVI